jgi:hypothetical protein
MNQKIKVEGKMKFWICTKCDHEVYAEGKPSIKWTDGHVCNFVSEDDPTLELDIDPGDKDGDE